MTVDGTDTDGYRHAIIHLSLAVVMSHLSMG
jgi:hypothetical protein